ncbi:hypothetical protein [Stappia sp.]|uniref:DUF7936 family protein n=1 Tax=Stappia sp. TaxID=1870903 RepID=UPI003C7CEBD5
MTITYTWSFPTLETKPSVEGLTDVVHVVHWRLRGEDADGVLFEDYGTVTMEGPDPENFTPFADLTEADVLEWIAGEIDVDERKAVVAAQIDRKKNPPVVAKAAPWA